MATYASRPAWELRARSIGGARVVVPLGIGVLLAVSVLLHTVALDVGFWIDEGLSVGIADRPLLEIPGVLRQDGSPPLYYMLLNLWMALAGQSEVGVHWLSVLFAALCVPVAFWAGWSLDRPRTAWVAALLAAVNPFITQYAQEGRMYALVILLGLIATTCWLLAFTRAAPSRAPALGFAVAFALMLYTHNWALFFGAASGIAWLVMVWLERGEERAWLLRTGLLAYGLFVVLYAPWLPFAIDQAASTGAPWSRVPSPEELWLVPSRILGEAAAYVVLLAGGAGLVTLVGRRGQGKLTALGRAVVALGLIALLTYVLAWLASQVSPAWANRYLSAGLAPLLLLTAVGLAHAGRIGLAGVALVTILWAGDGPPDLKSNVRAVSASIAPSLQAGDVVLPTQPEQVSVLHYYLPEGLRYATLTGPVPDVGVTDWRDGVERLRATSAERDLEPILDAIRPGGRIVLILPIIHSLRSWSAPWTELIRLRSEEWVQHISNDRRFALTAVEPDVPTPPGTPHAVRAQVYVKR